MINKGHHEQWDVFYAAVVVVAESEDEARKIHPDENVSVKDGKWVSYFPDGDEYEISENNGWPLYGGKVDVKCIGTASPEQKHGVVLASFNEFN